MSNKSGDLKDSSGSDCSKNSQSKLQIKDDLKGIQQKPRIVSSRYKQAAVKASQKSLSSSSELSKSGPLEKLRAKMNPSALQRNVPRVRSSMKTTNLLSSKLGAPSSNIQRLHSTAVNSSVFLEKTQLGSPEFFSTTIVAGQKDFRSARANSMDSSAHLSDISEICPLMKDDQKEDIAVVPKHTDRDLNVEQQRDFTAEEINAEYLKYLTWAYIDVKSEESFQKQVKEAQKQILFLTQIIAQEEKEESEEKEKLQLLHQYELVCQNHELMKKELEALNESIDPSEKALKNLSHNLEHQMNQIKLENIYMSSDEEAYKEQLNEALQEGCNSLSSLNSNMHPSMNLLQETSKLFTAISEESDHIESCLKESEKAANLKIQESSLSLSLKS